MMQRGGTEFGHQSKGQVTLTRMDTLVLTVSQDARFHVLINRCAGRMYPLKRVYMAVTVLPVALQCSTHASYGGSRSLPTSSISCRSDLHVSSLFWLTSRPIDRRHLHP